MATVQVTGNLADEPVVRATGAGDPVVNFTVASTERIYDREKSEWRDGDTLFLRCVIYREAGRNFAGSVKKGTRVSVVGRLKPNDYEKDGVKRYGYVLEVDDAAVSTRFAQYQPRELETAGEPSRGRRAAVPDDGRPF